MTEPTSVTRQPDQAAAWQEYLGAARRLDAVRRGAASAAGEQAESVQAAREELTGVRARLVPQQSLLRGLGVPEVELLPSQPEVAAAGSAMASGPEAVLSALRQARSAADFADASVLDASGGGPVRWTAMAPEWLRGLLVYGTFALAAVVVQLVLYVAGGRDFPPALALLTGFLLPCVAFAAGWATTGLLFSAASGARAHRAVALGALACLVPALLGCGAAGLLAL